MRRDSFERFYLEKIALGEGCGCAEHVARLHELDHLARPVRATHRLRIPGGQLASASLTLIHRLLMAALSRTGYRSLHVDRRPGDDPPFWFNGKPARKSQVTYRKTTG